MNRDNMNIILKGMWIGGTMTVPGVSGGSMAMIMGVYDRLISSISSFFKEPAESMAFLLKFVLGAGIGMVLFSRFISYLFTTRADVPLRFFFLGAVAGGVPMIYREAGVKKLDLGAVAYPVIGILGVVLLALIPPGIFTPDGSFGPGALVRGFERANGLKLNYRFAPRRAGDITAIWADPTLANTLLGWRAERPLEETLRTAWQWQLHLGQR